MVLYDCALINSDEELAEYSDTTLPGYMGVMQDWNADIHYCQRSFWMVHMYLEIMFSSLLSSILSIYLDTVRFSILLCRYSCVHAEEVDAPARVVLARHLPLVLDDGEDVLQGNVDHVRQLHTC